MKQYKVTGMSCAACSARVEKAVSSLQGVTSCSVNLLTNSMVVEGTVEPDIVISAVKKAGYGATLQGKEEKVAKEVKTATDGTKKRFFVSLGFLLVLMYLAMGSMIHLPQPVFLQNPVAMGIAQMIFAGVIMVINQKFFVNGVKGVIFKAPNMDTLVALGSGASFVYSVYALFCRVADPLVMTDLYFESAGMILVLITFGKMLEARAKGKTTDALKGLMNLAPKTALLERDGKEVVVSVTEVQKNEIFVVKPGESIPVDGEVIFGYSAVDESALTGESIPAEKVVGSGVSAGTINQSGVLRCRATRVGEDTTLSQIIKTVTDSSATKAPIAKIADKVSGFFVPAVMGIALITMIVWLIVGKDVGFSIARGISVLVISCPCALGLATPVAIMVGNGVGARKGVLFKTAVALETTGKTDIVVLDKTGTITSGKPTVTDIIPAEGVDNEYLLRTAVNIEQHSEHPLAKAIMEMGQKEDILPVEITDFQVFPGNGLTGRQGDKVFYAGKRNFIEQFVKIDSETVKTADKLAENGKTPLFFSEDNKLLGTIFVADNIKEDSVEGIKQLQSMGIKVVMLTGDNRRTAEAIAKEVGVEEVIAEVLPDGKAKAIAELQKSGKVAMVGDGINDAPALVGADIGMAIGAGTDIAIDSADVVLMKNSLVDAVYAIKLSKATLLNIKENLFWAFFYNLLGIPLAAGVFISLFGWRLSPMICAGAMSLSSVCVVTNALRLNFFKGKDKKIKTKIKTKTRKVKKMEKTLKIEGMMCGHCSARVKKALEGLPEVEEAVVSHETGTAVVTLKTEMDYNKLKSVIKEEGYAVLD